MPIRKGRHYAVSCDKPNCNVSLNVTVPRHGWETKRFIRQTMVKEGWTLYEAGTVFCPECSKPVKEAPKPAVPVKPTVSTTKKETK